jgi:hypothetical protein
MKRKKHRKERKRIRKKKEYCRKERGRKEGERKGRKISATQAIIYNRAAGPRTHYWLLRREALSQTFVLPLSGSSFTYRPTPLLISFNVTPQLSFIVFSSISVLRLGRSDIKVTRFSVR